MPGEGDIFRLLQPGLMSVEELSEIMAQRGISCKNNNNKPKNDLVNQYEKHLLPLSQREFPKSHRGQIINRKINEENKQRKRDEPSESNLQYGFKEKASLKRPFSLESSRLKPPIDIASPKKICLSRKSSSDMDKIVINDRSKRNSESSSDDSKKEHSHKGDKPSPVKSPSSKKEAKEREKDEPSPKRKKIAWP